MGPTPEPQVGGAGRHALAFIVLTVFIDLLGAGILMPVIPYVAARFRDDAFTVGALSLVFSAAQFLALPLLGALSDRYGRRIVLLASLFGSGIGYVLFGVGGALWVLYVSRLLDGFTGGNISAAQAYIADVSSAKDRAKNMGLIGAAFGIGFIIGPAAGGALSKISLDAPAWAAAILCFANVAFGLLFLPESLPPARRKHGPLHIHEVNAFISVRKALREAPLRGLMLSSFALNLAMSGLQSNFAVLTLKRFGYGPDDNALLFSYIGLTAALSQGLLVRMAVPRIGEFPAMLTGFAFNVAGFAAIAYAPSPAWVLLAITLISMGNGLATPTLSSVLTQRAAPGEQGAVLGSWQALISLSRIVGPFIAGWTFDHLGSGAPYWLGTCFLAWGLYRLRTERRYTPTLYET